MLSAMELVFLRFPHLSENIFGQLNSEFLGKSKEVCRSWYDYLDGQKFLENRADKVKRVIETIGKLGAPKVHLHKKHLLIWKKTKKSIIDDARNGNFDLVHAKILKNIDAMYSKAIWNLLARYVRHPVFIAAYFGHMDVLIYLVDNLENKNPTVDGVESLLHMAASTGKLDIVKYITPKVVDINPKDNFGHTPLHYAVDRGMLDIVEYYMKKLEDKSPRDKVGNTPLHLAADSRQLIVFKYIIENVIEKNPRNKHGVTPLDLAREKGYLEIVKPVSTYLAKFNEQSRFDDAEIRQEQDAAFQATLRLDQERERQKLEAEEAKRHEEEAEKARIQADIDQKENIARQKIELASKIPNEPPVNEPTAVQIVIKLPEGQRLERRFHKSQSLKYLYYYVFCHPDSPDEFDITTNFPRKVLDCKPAESADHDPPSFEEAGLGKSTMLFVNDLEA